MNRTKLVRGALAALFLAAITVISANAQVIPAQDNTWTTGNGAQMDLSHFGNVNLTTLLGSAPTNSVVTFNGVPLSSQIGQADTLVRTEQIDVTSGTNSTNLTLEALSMASNPDLGLQDGRVYHITLGLAFAGSGTASFTRVNSDGGTYDSSFTVTPILTFTNVGTPHDVHTVDCSQQANACSFVMGGTGGDWTLSQTGGFDPATLGIPIVPAGVQLGGYTTVGRPRNNAIYPGVAGSRSGGFHPSPNNEIENAGQQWHRPNPPTDCATKAPAPSAPVHSAATSGTGLGTDGGSAGSPTPQRAIAICAVATTL
jgi:hypothetical protein